MDCKQNTDPLKLVREGTSQEQRTTQALEPTYAPVNERTPAHEMVFAQAYSAFLKYYTSSNVVSGSWKPFFSGDVSVQLAIASVQDVDEYRQQVKEMFNFLNDLSHDKPAFEATCKNRLGYLFSSIGTLAVRLDTLHTLLPSDFPLKASLQNAISGQLATYFGRLWAYYKHDQSLPVASQLIANAPAPINILGGSALPIAEAYAYSYSNSWIPAGSTAPDWATYLASIPPLNEYGVGSVFTQINRLATHNLFTSIFDQFLKVYARTVGDAKGALEATFANWDNHEPHYTLFLAFLRLQEYSRQETNTLTKRHLDFYYRDILRLREKPAKPSHAHLLVELAKHVPSYLLEGGERVKAGKDDLGKDAFFANDLDFVANQAKVGALKTLYRHRNAPSETLPSQDNRLFASPVANSDDGLGAALTSADQSWHPFYNKIYVDGTLTEIRMPKAEMGFALASHYLFMAEGERTVTLDMTVSGSTATLLTNHKTEITCLFTSAEGWTEKAPEIFTQTAATQLQVQVKLVGDDPAITAYNAKIHGYGFDTLLPLLLIKLKQDTSQYSYALFQDAKIQAVALTVHVNGLKTLAISNDFGPVDASKPFQPFGATPDTGSSLLIGSKELFQKHCSSVKLTINWQLKGLAYGTLPTATVTFLKNGVWANAETETPLSTADSVVLTLDNINNAIVDRPDFSENELYSTSSRNGFVRLALTGNFGQAAYLTALRNYLIAQSKTPATGTNPTPVPQIPVAASLSVEYTASQTIPLNSTLLPFEQRTARFFHLGPFGQAEQHPLLSSDGTLYLLPQFDFLRDGTKKESEAELYLGITGLQPPQNLALLFQVADGTADPLSQKPDPHIHWSYLRGNEWVAFAKNDVSDQTGGLLNSGIVTLAMPREATAINTLHPSGMHWIRMAVSEESAAVCQLVSVAAQAFRATFANRDNDPAFPANVLPAGTISKLDQPVADVKKVVQPFPTFGGRGAEAPNAFYTRVSERLRHKNRAIALWDYERLVLEAFPQIYKAKCLNHTQYEPGSTSSDEGIYKELAPGHVTLVTIPNQQFQNLRDPLRPYTSLGLLQEIAAFLQKRIACFVRLHVKNPQFEEVKVVSKVRFYEGFDETFYTAKLQESITRFLSPWAFSEGSSPSFGGQLYQSVLINFVEEQPYVDYVTDFQLLHLLGTSEIPKVEVEGSKVVSILVSVPAKKHLITPITLAEEATSHKKCTCEV